MNAQLDPNFNSLKGHFLIATPVINNGFFCRSLTYMCEHNASGAMGIVVNQVLDMDLSGVLAHLKIESLPQIKNKTAILAGGPVQMDHGFILHCGEPKWTESNKITEHVCLTSSKDILFDIALGKGPSEYLMALGYAGWGAGQLEAEMIHNSWLSVEADSDILFGHSPAERLSAAGRRLGIDVDLLSSESGHA